MTKLPRLAGPSTVVACLFPVAALAQQEPAGPSLSLPTLSVAGSSAVGPDQGFVPEETMTGAKVETPIERIPQSVSIVTQEQLQQRQPQNLEQAIAYVPGVTPSPWGADNRFAQFLIRGFDVGTYGVFRDGLAQKVVGFSGFQIEPYTLQRVEVLRGPNAVLYGESEPGGIVNTITKRPVFEPLREGFLAYGPFDSRQGGFDIGGPAGDGTLAWRLTGLLRDGETALANSYDDRALIAPALTWQIDPDTSLTLLTNFQRDKTSPALYLPVAGEDYPAAVGGLPGWMWDTLPEGNHFEADIASAGWLFEHDVSASLTLRQNLRLAQQKTDYRDFYFNGMASDRVMSYADFSVKETATAFVIDNQAVARFMLGPTDHTLLVGLDYSNRQADGTYGLDDSYLIPVDDPQVSFRRTAPEVYQDGVEGAEQVGLYAHDQAQITEAALLTFGLRQSWVRNWFDDHLDDAGDTDQDYGNLSGDIGFVYQLPNGVAPYASYSTGFVTNIGTTFEGDLFEPTEAEQVEIGARWRPESFNALFSAALFQISKTNVLTTDPNHPNEWIQTGEVRHRGLELEADLSLADGLSAVAAYTYIDAEIVVSNDGDEGNRPALVPEHEASVWANYAFPEGAFEGLSFGAGLRYVGESFGDTSNLRVTPAHTTADAALRYQRGALEGAINVSNLFDNDYYAICYAGGGCAPADPREIILTVTARF